MFIQTETTPNPETLKFIPGCEVMVSGNAEFSSLPEAEKRSPLAARLLNITGVGSVFLSNDFISVTKKEVNDWAELKAHILSTIMEHFTVGMPVMVDEGDYSEDNLAEGVSDIDSEIVVQIKELLDTNIRPAVAQDGGDIVFHSFEEGIVYLKMVGACAGCPSSSLTLKSGVENMLKHYIPEIIEVRQV